MVPTAYLQLKNMPMTLNGKIDLKSLPEPTIYRGKSSAKSENQIEKDFCKIFEEILQIEDISPEENFFDLGGTSLLVTCVVVMAQKIGYKVNFSDVFTSKTPLELATLQKKIFPAKLLTTQLQITITQNFKKFSAQTTWKISGATNWSRLKIF